MVVDAIADLVQAKGHFAEFWTAFDDVKKVKGCLVENLLAFLSDQLELYFFLRCVMRDDGVELYGEVDYVAQILDTLLVIRCRRSEGTQAYRLPCSVQYLHHQGLSDGWQTLDRRGRQGERKLLKRGLAHSLAPGI